MIWFILATATLLRLISLDQSLWLDEAINVLALKDNSLSDLVFKYSIADFHPPGFVILLWFWTKLFGFSEIALRLPSVIFGVGTVYLVYYIGRVIHSNKFGLIAALLLAISPLHIYYSQEARMYSMAAFAVTFSVLSLLIFLKKPHKFKYWLIFSFLLILSTDYLAYLIFPTQFIFIFLMYRSFLKSWLLNFLVSIILWAWWIPVFFQQLQNGLTTAASVSGWKEVVGGFGLKELVLTYIKFIIGRISYSNDLIYLGLFFPVGLLFLVLITKALGNSSKDQKLLIGSWLLVPIFLGSAISLVVPVYSYFRLIFVLPAFVLLVSLGIFSFRKKITSVLIVLVGGVFGVCTFIYLFFPNFHREDWKGLVNFLSEVNTLVLTENSGSLDPVRFYDSNQKLNIKPALTKFPAHQPTDIIDLNKNLQDKTKVYLLDYLVEISDPNRLVTKQLTNLGFKQTRILNFRGVGFLYQYERR